MYYNVPSATAVWRLPFFFKPHGIRNEHVRLRVCSRKWKNNTTQSTTCVLTGFGDTRESQIGCTAWCANFGWGSCASNAADHIVDTQRCRKTNDARKIPYQVIHNWILYTLVLTFFRVGKHMRDLLGWRRGHRYLCVGKILEYQEKENVHIKYMHRTAHTECFHNWWLVVARRTNKICGCVRTLPGRVAQK